MVLLTEFLGKHCTVQIDWWLIGIVLTLADYGSERNLIWMQPWKRSASTYEYFPICQILCTNYRLVNYLTYTLYY